MSISKIVRARLESSYHRVQPKLAGTRGVHLEV